MTQVVQVQSHSLPTPKLKLSIKRKLPPVPDSQPSPKLRLKLSSALHAIQKAKEDNAEHDSDDDDEFPPKSFGSLKMRPDRRYHLLLLDILYRKVQGALTLTSFRNRINLATMNGFPVPILLLNP